MLVNLNTIVNDLINSHGTINMQGLQSGRGDVINHNIQSTGDINFGLQNLFSLGKVVTVGKDLVHVGEDAYKTYNDIRGLQNLNTITNDYINSHGTINMHGLKQGGDIHNKKIDITGDLNFGGLQNLGILHNIDKGLSLVDHAASTTHKVVGAVNDVRHAIGRLQNLGIINNVVQAVEKRVPYVMPVVHDVSKDVHDGVQVYNDYQNNKGVKDLIHDGMTVVHDIKPTVVDARHLISGHILL